LHEIESRIDATENTSSEMQPYRSIGEFAKEVRLMISNAMRYNSDESQIYEDARYMLGLLETRLSSSAL
jgi:hypothetical protein